VPGTWSATSELLTTSLAPHFPGITFAEVRYRVKTWNELPSCIADAEAALDLVDGRGVDTAILIGFSMGGAVSIGVAGHEAVGAVVGLAPWIPERLPVDGLRGKRFDVLGPLAPRDPRCQPHDLPPRVRAGALARRRGQLHADPAWAARSRGAASVRRAATPPRLAGVDRPRPSGARALRLALP
jgi:pimeloyl-ACP methyl ester carboxylesterase